MLLLEIAAQGVRGALPSGGRVALRPGYNVVGGDGAALRQLLDALLYAGGPDAGALERAAPAGAPVRAGLTFAGDDGVTYRLVRDFRAAAQLHRYDSLTRSFSLVSADLGTIAAHLRSPVGVPPRERRDALLALSAADLPSRRTATPVPSRLVPDPRRPDVQRKRATLASLRAERERALQSTELQGRLDALQTRLFKSEEALRDGSRVRDADAAAQAALAELGQIAAAEADLGDPEERLEAFEDAIARRDEASGKVAAERDTIEQGASPAPLWKLPALWAAVGAGFAAVGAAVVGVRWSPTLRYVALLDVPAFGWAGWVALRWIDRLERAGRLERRRAHVDEFERKAREQFVRDTAKVEDALAVAGVATVAELRERLGKLREVRDAAAAARARLVAWQESPEIRDAADAHGRLSDEIRDVETALARTAGGFVRDLPAVEAEIAQLEQEVAAGGAGAGEDGQADDGGADAGQADERATDAGESGAGQGAVQSGGPGARRALAGRLAPLRGPLEALLESAAAALGGDPARRRVDLSARAAELAAALSLQRLTMSVEAGGLRIASAARASRDADAAPADRDLCFVALRLAALEAALAAGGCVALADDAFVALPEAARRVAARVLKAAARGGQIVHATADPAFREAADHVAA